MLKGMWATAAVPALTVVVTAVVTILGARRQYSGRIHTTEAAQLWDENRDLRADLRAEIISLKVEIAALRVEIAVLREKLRANEQPGGV